MNEYSDYVISTQTQYYGSDASEEYAERAAEIIASHIRAEYPDVAVKITSEFQRDNDPDMQQWVNDNWIDWVHPVSADPVDQILGSTLRAKELRENITGDYSYDERYRMAREAVHETGTQTDADEHAETVAILKSLGYAKDAA